MRGPEVYQSEEEMVGWRAWARQNGWDGVRWNAGGDGRGWWDEWSGGMGLEHVLRRTNATLLRIRWVGGGGEEEGWWWMSCIGLT